jgi:hypothetical protein
VEEEREDPAQARREVHVGLPAPHLPVGHQDATGEHRDREVAVDTLVGPEAFVANGPETPEPTRRQERAAGKGGRGDVVQAVVVALEAERAGHDRRGVVLLVQELADERGERGIGATASR